MKKIKLFLLSAFVLSSILSNSANATCMVKSCTDSDGGNITKVAGAVTQVDSCSPPGGPAKLNTTISKDKCVSGPRGQSGKHTEYFCEMNQYVHAKVATAKTTDCYLCNREGTACAQRCAPNQRCFDVP